MKALINKILVIAILGVGLVACSKEEVKPFTAPGASANVNDLSTKSLTGIITSEEAQLEAQKGATSEGDNTGVTTDTNSEDGSGITDGGTSSDYDSKGTKRKPGKN